MQNLLILFNNYYEPNVIEKHIDILKEKGAVAFGKIRSKLNTNQAFNIENYANLSTPLQLFLTDYSTLFVAKVIQVSAERANIPAPEYYEKKGLEVEAWFIIKDIRELVHKDFENIRDHYLVGFTTPLYGNHTYALYGNQYQYPLEVKMKEEINYFPDDEKPHYPDIYKSSEFQRIKSNLVHYRFGDLSHKLHPIGFENLIFAEMEFDQNKENKLYDFSGVAVKYGKAIEYEAYLFFKTLFCFLANINQEILDISFEVNGMPYKINDLHSFKPNLGTYKHLLTNQLIAITIDESPIRWVKNRLSFHITEVQKIRNSSAHEGKATLDEIIDFRKKVLGIEEIQIIPDFLNRRIYISKMQNNLSS